MTRKILIFVMGILVGGGVWVATNVMRVRSGEAPPAVEVKKISETSEDEGAGEFEESMESDENSDVCNDVEEKQELKDQ